MAIRPNPFLTDEDNPELSDDELAAMRPAADILPAGALAMLIASTPRAEARPADRLHTEKDEFPSQGARRRRRA